MLRTLWFQLCLIAHQIYLWPRLLRAERTLRAGRLEEARAIAHQMAREWSRVLCWAAGCTVTVHGRENLPKNRAVLILSNHQGMFDIPVIAGWTGLSLAFMAKAELSRIPLVSRWMRLTGCVFLMREDRKQAVEAVRDTIQRMQEGVSMVIFPEGTRSNSEQLGEFKRGSANIALKAGVPILPVTVSGAWRMRHGDRGLVQPGKVDLYIHPLVYPDLLTPEQRENLAEHVKAIIAGPIAHLQAPAPAAETAGAPVNPPAAPPPAPS
jgi:1-acyl-sn-glycerol-3-phosphate acyltransferase